MPIYVFVIAFFLFVFRVIYAEEVITEALGKTAREAATLIEDDSPTNRVILEGLFRKNVVTPDFVEKLNILNSDVENDVIILRASYTMRFPISFFGRKSFGMKNCVAERCFNGYRYDEADSNTDEKYVYITETGSAYHKTTSCNYLDLSIRPVPSGEIGSLRNLSGGKYDKCWCAVNGQTYYYITNYGTNYHGRLDCSGLKRTVHKVSIEEVQGRHPCRKCYGG